MGILWESPHGDPYSSPMGIPIGPCGNLHEDSYRTLWESPWRSLQQSYGNPVGIPMGMGIPIPTATLQIIPRVKLGGEVNLGCYTGDFAPKIQRNFQGGLVSMKLASYIFSGIFLYVLLSRLSL